MDRIGLDKKFGTLVKMFPAKKIKKIRCSQYDHKKIGSIVLSSPIPTDKKNIVFRFLSINKRKKEYGNRHGLPFICVFYIFSFSVFCSLLLTQKTRGR